ncbi:bifunctional riboflavin kinase/FAD synthetase [Ferruginibacter sp. HRS2-29]|uniref:bifunctional riboflavin kinase/FAD synthetase n=1 Tax=Ferruginibacter sp. HRS2-29 TaxID=2487334 RepID=UPI0020CC97A4|nr:bifunctional riboflavin kinase/FAD synthetase [Ferruginibacter sp. HRS2-29]MCP9751382.1 bifunctional riboflavin kinase/FAD synthetase [Ferruginibacter sp. HRS2-29]
MQVYKNIAELPEFKNAVVTIGTFDGVHLGHAKILQQLVKEAKAVDGTPVLITFYPHPKQVVINNKNPVYTLSSQIEKYRLLEEKGINHIVEVPFNKDFAEQPAAEYIKNFLVDKFHPHTIIIGYDHRFGRNREGDFRLLEKECAHYGVIVKEIPEKVLQDIIISSTKVRDALHDGDITAASAYLGYDYFFTGTVIEGNKLGRTIGYPTANLQIQDEQKLIPANGVYAVDVLLDPSKGDKAVLLKGMMNIGVRPTVDGTKRVIEVNIFDFDEMIYGRELKITIRKRLRNEIKFNGLEELKTQLAKDKEAAGGG